MKNPEIINFLPEKIETIGWREKFSLKCYGSVINIRSDREGFKSELLKYLPVFEQSDSFEYSTKAVSLVTREEQNINGLYYNNERVSEFEKFEGEAVESVADKILMIMAVVSLPSKLYLHAGAVVWQGLGILIPGTSYSGKTTLVKEFIKAGADYYSDDCIILDEGCRMLPFPRDLAVRTENGRVHRSAEFYGAKNGVEGTRIDLILFPEYAPDAVWKLVKLLPGESVLKLMDNLYYRASVGLAPAKIVEFLSDLTKQTQIFGGTRGEASEVVSWVYQNFRHEKNAA